MILGYSIAGHDNDYSMYQHLKLDDCARYKDVYTINRIDAALVFTNLKVEFSSSDDYSSTYDGFTIVSEKFKTFCEGEGYVGLEFVALAGGNYYWFKVHTVVEYDATGRGTRFINFDKDCDGFEEIIGANPVYLKDKRILADGFYRTDLCFGSYAGKSPLFLIGPGTKEKLEQAGFESIVFEEILSEYE
jgi:hypothetical protein